MQVIRDILDNRVPILSLMIEKTRLNVYLDGRVEYLDGHKRRTLINNRVPLLLQGMFQSKSGSQGESINAPAGRTSNRFGGSERSQV